MESRTVPTQPAESPLAESTPKLDAGEPCRPDPPILVPVEFVAEADRDHFERCVAESDCRLFSATSGRSGSYVVAGYPGALGSLRTLLKPVRGLDLARSAIEQVLVPGAGLEGFPRMSSDLYKKTEVERDTEVPKGTILHVSREFTFDAAHNLPRYQGKCERLHGHTFKVRVTVAAEIDTWSGIAFDFHDMKKHVEAKVVKLLDHAYVNEIVPNPSAEFIAIWTWEQLAGLPLHEVAVWETPSCFVSYFGPPKPAPAPKAAPLV